MRLAEAEAAMDVQEAHLALAAFGEALCRLAGEFVRRSDDEAGETLLRIRLAVPEPLQRAGAPDDAIAFSEWGRPAGSHPSADTWQGFGRWSRARLGRDRDLKAQEAGCQAGERALDPCRMVRGDIVADQAPGRRKPHMAVGYLRQR